MTDAQALIAPALVARMWLPWLGALAVPLSIAAALGALAVTGSL